MRIVLHVGQGKTGTTAIQKILSLNRERLRSIGALYPVARVGGSSFDVGHHNPVADALLGVSSFPYLTAEQYFSSFFREAAACDTSDIILSGEHFFGGHPRPWDVRGEDEFFALYRQKISALRSYTSGVTVDLIVYLRPQLEWLVSAISHTLKIEGLIRPSGVYVDDRSFFEMMVPALRYATLLSIWEEVLKPNSITVIPYKRSELIGGSSTSDFLERAGLGGFQIQYGRPDLVVNEAISREFLEAKKRFRSASRTKAGERVLIDCMERASKNHGLGIPYDVDAELRAAVLQFASLENRKIPNRYIAGSDSLYEECEDIGTGARPVVSEDDVQWAERLLSKELRGWRARIATCNHWLRALLRWRARWLHSGLQRVKMVYERMAARN